MRKTLALLALAIALQATSTLVLGQAAAPPEPPEVKLCAACHGPQGNSVIAINPSLAGQSWRYIYLQLRDFKAGRRSDPQMTTVAKDLSTETMIALGNWYAAQKPAASTFKVDSAKVTEGKKISDAALCPMCHMGGFAGQNEVPRTAGLHYEYVVKQLQDFKHRRRTNDGGSMTSVAGTLEPQDIENLAHYLVGL